MPQNQFITHKGIKNEVVINLVNKHEAAKILGISPSTLKQYRLAHNSTLVEGIHYHIWNQRTIRYNPDLMADWAINRSNPKAHQQTIERYLSSFASKQPRVKERQANGK